MRADAAPPTNANTLHAIDEVRRRGDPVTFAGIAREAGVSGWFVRNQPDVRAAIERAAGEHESGGTPDKRTLGNNTSTAGLRSELLLAREEIRDLRRDRDQMRQRLRESLGAELEQASRAELVQRVAELERRNHELLDEHGTATTLAAQASAELATAQSDLAGARAANRRFIRDVNVRTDPVDHQVRG